MADTTDGSPPTDPVAAQMGPYLVELTAGKRYFFCTCGLSKNQPFCDGAHKGTGLEPHVFVAKEDGPAPLCGCKQTGDAPYCDGTHLFV